MQPGTPFVHFADVGDLQTAQVCAAVLEDAGIPARVHGESLGPYPVTIGRLAVTEIWVPADTVEEARVVMLETEIEHTLNEGDDAGSDLSGSVPMRIAAVGVLVTLTWAVVRGLLRVF